MCCHSGAAGSSSGGGHAACAEHEASLEALAEALQAREAAAAALAEARGVRHACLPVCLHACQHAASLARVHEATSSVCASELLSRDLLCSFRMTWMLCDADEGSQVRRYCMRRLQRLRRRSAAAS